MKKERLMKDRNVLRRKCVEEIEDVLEELMNEENERDED